MGLLLLLLLRLLVMVLLVLLLLQVLLVLLQVLLLLKSWLGLSDKGLGWSESILQVGIEHIHARVSDVPDHGIGGVELAKFLGQFIIDKPVIAQVAGGHL